MTKEATSNLGERSPWAGKLVRLEQVEEELVFLWQMSADNMRTGQNIDVRTSVLNLVICAPDIESARRASAMLRELSSTHLGRVIVMIIDDRTDLPPAVSSWVTLRCFSVISDLMRHCFEQITVLVTGSAISSSAYILQPLLKPDLPVYLWWLGDPPANPASFFNDLIELSTRVIVDSTSFFNPEQDILALASLSQAFPDSAISDLNWGRITPWRELVAQFFDVMDYRPYLAGVNAIEIEHAAAPLAAQTLNEQGEVSPNPARALLLAGWLKAGLGWSIISGSTIAQHDTASGTYHWQLERAISPYTTPRVLDLASGNRAKPTSAQVATIDIRPQVLSDMRPGSLSLVRLTSAVEGRQATFTISRESDPNYVLTSVELSHETRPQRTVRLAATRKESELFNEELEITGHDHLFEQALQEIAGLLDVARS